MDVRGFLPHSQNPMFKIEHPPTQPAGKGKHWWQLSGAEQRIVHCGLIERKVQFRYERQQGVGQDWLAERPGLGKNHLRKATGILCY